LNHSEYPKIDTTATGQQIAHLMQAKGLRVQDLQNYLGLSAPQAIYKWLRGEGLPCIDNLFALSELMGISIDDILIKERLDTNPCYRVLRSDRSDDKAITYFIVGVSPNLAEDSVQRM
jgi:transcriptional regulator with XRE-family HTH domain